MDYSAMIQNRKSVRAFRSKPVPKEIIHTISEYYETDCKRLIPELPTKLMIFDESKQELIEGTAGYEKCMSGMPSYLVLLSEDRPEAEINGGYIMQDLILKLTEMEVASCWITYANAAEVSDALEISALGKIVAIAAFGYEERTSKFMRFNFKNMLNLDTKAKRGYFAPKKGIYDMVCLDKIGNTDGLDEVIGFYNDMLWQSFYAATLSPSYLNRQPYVFVVKEHKVVLVNVPDEYTDEVSRKSGLGIVMLHFAAVAGKQMLKGSWTLGDEGIVELPEGYTAAATYEI